MAWRTDMLQHIFVFEQAVVTPYTLATIFVPAFLSYYAMAVLVQLPHTGLYRASLIPVVFWLAFRAHMSLDFSWNYPGYAHLNKALAMGMFTIATRSTAWVFAQRPYTRLRVCRSENGTDHNHNGGTPTKHAVSVSSAMWNAWDLSANLRGIGWDGPPKMHVPTPYIEVESRSLFFLLSLCRFIFFALVLDILCRFGHSFGPDTFGTPRGGTIFDPLLSPLERHMKSSIVMVLAGIVAYVLLEALYQLHAALFVLLFQQHPSRWPPLFDSPWLSTSLTDFWGRRWQQLFRGVFVAVGSRPVERYLGRAGSVIGAFALSGVLHDVGMRGMRRGTDSDTVLVMGFFLLHGVGVIMEYAWKQATGRRVGGIMGWLWTWSWFVPGQLIVDVWARSGLVGSAFFPEGYRPTTLISRLLAQMNVNELL